MSKKTLLLNSNYEVLSFIGEKKLIKLFFKDKLEVISIWDDKICWKSGYLNHPSVVRLKYYIKINHYLSSFSRKAVLKRDDYTCQFCNKKLLPSQITIDHVLPKSQGGITSFTNCVVSCQGCNGKKANKTPEQAGMILLKKPTHPKFSTKFYIKDFQDHWNNDWNNFLI